MGLVMMAPARGSSKYVLVRGGALRWSSLVGAGSSAAGALTMRLIIGRSWGGMEVPWASAASLSSSSYRLMSCITWAVSVAASTLERTHRGRGCWWILIGRSMGVPCIASMRDGSTSSKSSN